MGVAIPPLRTLMSAGTPRGGRSRLSGPCHPFLEKPRTRRGGGSGGRLRRRETPRLQSRRIPRTLLNNANLVLLARAGSGKLVSFDRCLRRPSRAGVGNTIHETTFECPRSRTFRFVSPSARRRLRCPRLMYQAETFPFLMFLLSKSPTIRTRKISPSSLGRVPKFVRRMGLRCSATPVLALSPVVS